MNIKTPDDWWILVDSHWQNILDIFYNIGAPLERNEAGYWWADEIFTEATRHEKTLIRTLEEAKRSEDHETLHDLFQKAWMAEPDEKYIHSWPSWNILCDLCSEYWVFQPENISEIE